MEPQEIAVFDGETPSFTAVLIFSQGGTSSMVYGRDSILLTAPLPGD